MPCGLADAPGELEEAEQALQRALALNEKNFETWFWLGHLHFRKDEPAQAARAFGRALELRPDDRETTVFLAMAHIESGDTQEARRLLSRAHEAWPEDAQIMYHLGVVSDRTGNTDTAILWFERALAIDGKYGEAHLGRGKALVKKGTAEAIEKAILAFDQACRAMPGDFESHYNLGVLLLQTGNPQDALPRLERALQIRPNGEFAPRLRQEIERIRG